MSGGLWRSLGRALGQVGQVGEARDALLQAVQLQPANGATHLELAEIDLKQGDYLEAAQGLALAMELDPDLPTSQGMLYRLLGIDENTDQERHLRLCAAALDSQLDPSQSNACREWLRISSAP